MSNFNQFPLSGIPQFFLNWFFQHGIKVLVIIFIASLIDNIIINFISKLVRSIVKKTGEKNSKISSQKATTLVNALNSVLHFIVWTVALVTILPEFSINIAPLLAGLGLAGLALGMGVRDVIQDYISGFIILLEDQYRVGEEARIADIRGEIIDLNLRKTIIKDQEGTLHFISNRQIKISSNYSRKI